jgi:hypothetical protein
MKRKTNKNKKYDKPVSLYGIKPEQVLGLFMKIRPKKHKGRHALSCA